MTLANFAKLAWSHRTKILGYMQVVVAALAVADQALVTAVFGQSGLRGILLISGILTAIVGHYNSQKNKPAPGEA